MTFPETSEFPGKWEGATPAGANWKFALQIAEFPGKWEVCPTAIALHSGHGYTETMEFNWDDQKAERNRAKHGVTFEEAMSVFADPLAVIFDDDTHSISEIREIIIGHSREQRLLLVSFTERDSVVRIINAREATRGERKDYEENVSY